MYKKDKRCLM